MQFNVQYKSENFSYSRGSLHLIAQSTKSIGIKFGWKGFLFLLI